jgi:hypothetical protein
MAQTELTYKIIKKTKNRDKPYRKELNCDGQECLICVLFGSVLGFFEQF